jgi:tetratricopeptide (TPR) repeat protein
MVKFTYLKPHSSWVAISLLGILIPNALPSMALPPQPLLLSQETADEYILRGKKRSFERDFQGAIADYDQAIRIQPDNPWGYNGRGEARAKLQDYQGAITDYDQAIRIKPDFALAYVNRGFARFNLQDYRGAIADYDQAIRIQPELAWAYYRRGLAWFRQGNYQAALADYEQALQQFPDIKKSKDFENYGSEARQRLNTSVATAPPAPQSGSTSNPISISRPTPPQPTSLLVRSKPDPASAPNPKVVPPPITRPEPTTTPKPGGTPVVVATPSVNVYRIANQTTVRIDGQNPGSGVIISRFANTYYVLTARHVVETPDEYTVVTSNGKKFLIDYKKVKKFTNVDLAVVKFTSSESFPIAQLGNSEQIAQGENIFVSGWPIIDGSSNQQVTPGQITGFRTGDANGYELTYSNPTGGGMSGGPVFNSKGQVIGIHGRGGGNQEVGKIGINLGMPIHLFLRQAPQAGVNVQQLGLSTQR